MPDFTTLPDGWVEIKHDVGDPLTDREHTEEFDATWSSQDEQISVTSRHMQDADGTVSFPVVVEQTLESEDGLETTVQSHALVEDDRKTAERVAAEFMHEVNDGLHRLRLIRVDERNGFYHFSCISDSELPGDMTGDQLIDSIDNEAYDDDIDELPDNFEPEPGSEQTLQVDVFPRPEEEFEDENDET